MRRKKNPSVLLHIRAITFSANDWEWNDSSDNYLVKIKTIHNRGECFQISGKNINQLKKSIFLMEITISGMMSQWFHRSR